MNVTRPPRPPYEPRWLKASTVLLAIAWFAGAVASVLKDDYLTTFVAAVSIGYALQVAQFLRAVEYRRLFPPTQTRTDKKEHW